MESNIFCVAFRSMESNIFCLACSFSSSVLYSSASVGAYPYILGIEAAMSISLEKDPRLTRPSLFVSASTNILMRQWYSSAYESLFLSLMARLMNQMKSSLDLLKPVMLVVTEDDMVKLRDKIHKTN